MDIVQEIRRLLDERGVDYYEYSRTMYHVFAFDYCDACDDYLSEIEIFGASIYATRNYLTPEQAIAVMLGDRNLTAKQVRECVEDLYWEGYNDGYVHRGHGIEETDWQVITDKLNAAWNSRAERTCKVTCHELKEVK